LGLANLAGVASGLGLVLTHMGLGLAAIKVIDMAVEQQRTNERAVLAGGT